MASVSATSPIDIIGGVNTHQALHTAAVVELTGAVLGPSVLHHPAGYRAMLPWFAPTATWSASGSRPPAAIGPASPATWPWPECRVGGHRPDTAHRRGRGTDDAPDAIAAARAALTGQRLSVAKDRSGAVEALRVLRTTRKTAVRCRRVLQQPAVTVGAGLLHVTATVRWIPLLPAAYGTRVARPASTTMLVPDGYGAPRAEGEACPWRPLDRYHFGRQMV
jgi:hypothetical protein